MNYPANATVPDFGRPAQNPIGIWAAGTNPHRNLRGRRKAVSGLWAAGTKPHRNMGGRHKTPSEYGRPAQKPIGIWPASANPHRGFGREAQSCLGSLAYRLKSHWDYGREERSPIGIWAAGAKPLGDFRREAQSRIGILGGGAKPHRNIGGLHKVAWIFGVQVKAASGFSEYGLKPYQDFGRRRKTPSEYGRPAQNPVLYHFAG